LVNELREQERLRLETFSQLPAQATYLFDAASPEPERAGERLRVQKTRVRTVRSLDFSEFQAKEVLRHDTGREATRVHRSPQLESLVPAGGRYAYDVIAYVGMKTFLEGRKLADVQQALAERRPPLDIPLSSLYDVGLKFLFYLGELHRQSAPVLRDYLHQRGAVHWLVDGTLEPGTPLFFGIEEPEEGILLASWKLATENDDAIAACFTEAAERYGPPDTLLSDLSSAIARARETALPHTAHRVCHYHLVSDVGEDLYHAPQAALTKRLRSLKLRFRLQEQRRGQTKSLRHRLKDSEGQLLLADLINGRDVHVEFTDLLGKEVLLALHFWVMDYPNDGHRQGFPFDPYLLYFHRRVAKAHPALERLLTRQAVRQQAPQALLNFAAMLNHYLCDPDIVAAARDYEQACDVFERLRNALRLSAQGESPMRHPYILSADEQRHVGQSLTELRHELRESCHRGTEPHKQALCNIVLTHLDKYWPYLVATDDTHTPNTTTQRTSNNMERRWSSAKRTRRQTHGRRKLTRDFQALPEEYMLVPNLQNPRYVDLLLGSIDRLPDKLAQAGARAGPFTHWRNRRKPLNCGRLPKKLLRRHDFVQEILGVYDAECQALIDDLTPSN
jgi:hypothetical protein